MFPLKNEIRLNFWSGLRSKFLSTSLTISKAVNKKAVKKINSNVEQGHIENSVLSHY